MIKCQFCNQEFTAYRFLSSHLNRTHKYYDHKNYYDKYINSDDHLKKCICGNLLKFINLSIGYKDHCGNIECIKKIKVKKIEKTVLKRYGVKNYTQTKEYKEKTEQKSIKNYGVKHFLQSEIVKNKRKKTVNKLYDVDNVFQAKEIKDKIEENNFKKHGVKNSHQRKEVIKKTKETNLKEYGCICALQNKDVKRKTEETNLKEYGSKIYQKSEVYKQKQRNKMMQRLLNSNRLNDKVIPLFDKFTKVSDKDLLWKCIQCGKEFNCSIANGHIPRCFKCEPLLNGTSKVEIEIADFIEQYIKIERNKKFSGRKNIGVDYELDIFILEFKLGIEVDGLFHHSELTGGKDKNYHIEKDKYFEKLGIQVIHILDQEWIYDKEIIQSILLSKIHKNKNTIYARKCKIKEVSQNETIAFLDKNHIQKGMSSSIKIGLFFEDRLVSIMTFIKSRYNKNYKYEISRYCNILNTTVIGGFNKLLQYFINNVSNSIITYADARLSNGDIYKKNNFEFISHTPPNYFYIKNREIVGSRIKFQKHKLSSILPIYDDSLTEW